MGGNELKNERARANKKLDAATENVVDDTRTIRIAYLDDDVNDLELVKIFLEKNDSTLKVEITSSMNEFLEIIEQPFDCIVSDYRVWGIDIEEIYNRIREKSRAQIIIYTGLESSDVVERGFKAGITDYVQKSIDPEHYRILMVRIQHAVEMQRQERELSARARANRQLSFVVQQTSQGVSISDNDGVLLFSNFAWAEMHGYERQEISGKDIGVFYSDAGLAKSLMGEVRSQGSRKVRIEHRKKDGSVFSTLSTWSLLKDEEGGSIGIVRMARNWREIIRDIRDVGLLKGASIRSSTSEK